MIVSAVLFAIAANSDNLSVGISYGVKRRYIPWQYNIAIAMVTTAITLLALTAGRVLREHLLPDTPSWASGALLMMLAVWSTYKQPHTEALEDANREVPLYESLYLALTLSINNISLALAGGLGALSYGVVTATIFAFSIIMLSTGQWVGFNLAERIGGFLSHPFFGNVILFLAGVMMLFGF
jgi:putative Mn2+ efflux pump MntP